MKNANKDDYLNLFRMPNPVSITGRFSSITNSFINSIIPIIVPLNEEVKKALETLGMGIDNFNCAYCGDSVTEWDHLNPLVKDQQPTGYISEIHNLVPSCGKCNQSKGNKNWKEWILSEAILSPKSRHVSDLQTRIDKLENYCNLFKPTIVDFEKIIGKDKWTQYWTSWKSIKQELDSAQMVANEIKQKIAEYSGDT